MPIVTPSNSFLLAIDKQADESTVSSTADYSVPVFSANVGPVYDERRVEVTDAASIEADIYKGQTYWTGEAEFPAFSESLGRFIQAIWPTDTKTGAGPYVHTFSGLGGTQSWIALYTEWPGAGAFEQTFGKGLCTGIGFTATQDGGPCRVRFAAMGQVPSVANYSATVADDLADGYFTLQDASASIKLDYDTPNSSPSVSYTNIESVSINVDRPATPVLTADGVAVTNVSSGKLTASGTMSLFYNDWDAYRATYFGAVAGTAASATVVKGALLLNFEHTTTADTFSIYVPSVQFKAGLPQPNPSGDPLKLEVALNVMKPTSGDHVQPVLTNSVATAY